MVTTTIALLLLLRLLVLSLLELWHACVDTAVADPAEPFVPLCQAKPKADPDKK